MKQRCERKRNARRHTRKAAKTVFLSRIGIEHFLKIKRRKYETAHILEEEPEKLTKKTSIIISLFAKIADLIKIISIIFAYMIIFGYFCICK